MNDSIHQLYQSIILKHNHAPVSYVANPKATHSLEAYNPICGDQFNLYFDLENGIITNLSFHGYGCAISKASTSILVDRMEGLEIGAGKTLCQLFQSIVSPTEETLPQSDDQELMTFSIARKFPGRLKCASLSWDHLLDFFESRKI